jgi:hypothetical protein
MTGSDTRSRLGRSAKAETLTDRYFSDKTVKQLAAGFEPAPYKRR